MAVISIQNVGGFKGGDTGCLAAQRKPSEGVGARPQSMPCPARQPEYTAKVVIRAVSAPHSIIKLFKYRQLRRDYIGSYNRRPSLAHKIGSNWTGYTPPPPPCRHLLQ